MKTPTRQAASQRHIDVVFSLEPANRRDWTMMKGDGIGSDPNEQDWNSEPFYNVFACLPVDEENSGLPAVVNSDWLLTASREQLAMDQDSKPWNGFLIQKLSIAVAKVWTT